MEQGADRIEEGDLLLDRETALLRNVDNVKHAAVQVGERRDRLHLDGVALLERLVEHPRRIDDLPAHVLVIHVPNVERLGRESVRLHFDVGACDFVDKGRFAHVWVAGDNDRARCGVDGRQTHHVLAHLLKIFERALLPLHDGAHAAECGALERLATVQRVAVL